MNPPLWDGSFYVLDASVIDSLSMCEKPKLMCITQVGVQVQEDDNGDDDNDHGEEWMKNPPLYSKVWS